jgi:hypothetical protein
MKILELISILLSVLVAGVFWGPWIALSPSISTFQPEIFLAITHRLARNLGPLMTVLMPITLFSMLPVLVLSHSHQLRTFYLTLSGFALFLLALLVTVLIEVPIANQFTTWTAATLPANGQQLRDRWGSFHLVRIVSSIAGLGCLISGAIF